MRACPSASCSLGRTVGVPANGAVSNLAATPDAVLALRGSCAAAATTSCTSTSRSCRWSAGTRSAALGELPLVGTFHTYSENTLTNGIAAWRSAPGGG